MQRSFGETVGRPMAREDVDKGNQLRKLGNEAFKAGDFREAELYYTQCLQVQEMGQHSRGLALSNRAQTHLNLRKPAEALEDAVAALAIDPSSVKAQHRQVVALLELGDLQSANKAANEAKAVSKDPKFAATLDALLLKSKSGSTSVKDKTQKHIEASVLNKAWAAHKERCPPKDWLPPQLQKDWQWIPCSQGETQNLLLLFHGLGDLPTSYAKLATTMALPATAAIALAGPYTLGQEGEGRYWFEALDSEWEKLAEDKACKSLTQTRSILMALVSNLHCKGGWPHSRLHLFGFSQGGTVALDLASQYRGEVRLGSCVSVSGSLLGDPLKAQESNKNTFCAPILLTHGSRDDVVSRTEMQQSVDQLRALGAEAQLQSISGKGHSMINSEAEMRHIMAFWAKHLKSGPPSQAGDGTFVEVNPAGMPQGFESRQS